MHRNVFSGQECIFTNNDRIYGYHRPQTAGRLIELLQSLARNIPAHPDGERVTVLITDLAVRCEHNFHNDNLLGETHLFVAIIREIVDQVYKELRADGGEYVKG